LFIVSSPEKVPTLVGVNTTPSVAWPPPAGTLVGKGGTTAKGAVAVILEINNGAVPRFVIVTNTGALVVFRGVAGKVIWEGETAIDGACGVPKDSLATNAKVTTVDV